MLNFLLVFPSMAAQARTRLNQDPWQFSASAHESMYGA
jgi:hypothetical protein